MTARIHGSLQEDEARGFGRSRDEFLDFSANMNPFGPPASALAAARAADLTRYPDPDCRKLTQALAARLRVTGREILVGNGSSELIHLLVRAWVNPGDRAAIFTPTFGEYHASLEAMGADVQEIAAPAGDGFRWDMDAAISVLRDLKPAVTFLCSPNNPTGVYLDRSEVKRLAAVLTPGLLMLDEAYVSFVEQPWRGIRLAPNVAVLRSMTKEFTLPGLRIGYMVAPRSIVERSASLQPSWSVSTPAQDAALACLQEDGFLTESMARIRGVKEAFVGILCEADFKVHAGEANFVLIDVGDAAAIRRKLLQGGIAVRDCASFGLPQYIRACVRELADCRRLVAALQEARRAG